MISLEVRSSAGDKAGRQVILLPSGNLVWGRNLLRDLGFDNPRSRRLPGHYLCPEGVFFPQTYVREAGGRDVRLGGEPALLQLDGTLNRLKWDGAGVSAFERDGLDLGQSVNRHPPYPDLAGWTVVAGQTTDGDDPFRYLFAFNQDGKVLRTQPSKQGEFLVGGEPRTWEQITLLTEDLLLGVTRPRQPTTSAGGQRGRGGSGARGQSHHERFLVTSSWDGDTQLVTPLLIPQATSPIPGTRAIFASPAGNDPCFHVRRLGSQGLLLEASVALDAKPSPGYFTVRDGKVEPLLVPGLKVVIDGEEKTVFRVFPGLSTRSGRYAALGFTVEEDQRKRPLRYFVRLELPTPCSASVGG